jgi:hypothetical protein
MSNKKTSTKLKILRSRHATTLMLKGVNEASMQYKATHTRSTNIAMNYSMAICGALLYLNEHTELTIAIGYVNNRCQCWDGKIGLEITNNIYSNSLKPENKHDESAGRNM